MNKCGKTLRECEPKSGNVYLMGFMGCGKTKIGSLLADRLGRTFIDTDARIAADSGMTIVEIFEKEGENSFRKRESDLLRSIANSRGYVVSLGGGAVVNPDNWKIISGSGFTITLSYPPEIIARRLARQTDRPLIKQYRGQARLDRIASLMQVRSIHYQKADLVLHLNREVAPERVADALHAFLAEFS